MEKFLHFILVEGSIITGLYFVATFFVLLINQVTSGRYQEKLAHASLGIGNVMGAFAGALTPFCSCTTVPILEGMLRAKIRFGIAITFLMASPLVNEIVILIMLRAFGVIYTLVFIVLALIIPIFTGIGFDRLNLQKWLRQQPGPVEAEIEGYLGSSAAGTLPIPFPAKIRFAVKVGLVELKKALPYIVTGILIGGSIYGFVPKKFILLIGEKIPTEFQVVIFSLIGAPLYINMIAALPIALAFLQKGLTIGPITAFLISGAGTSISEMILLFKIFRLPLLVVYIIVMILAAMFMGLFFTYFSSLFAF
jgi:uncharacterized membrane protein YraQ (UPF0718 family)